VYMVMYMCRTLTIISHLINSFLDNILHYFTQQPVKLLIDIQDKILPAVVKLR